jgi:hypothetical protein
MMMNFKGKWKLFRARFIAHLFLLIVIFLVVSCKGADEAVELPENNDTAVSSSLVLTPDASDANTTPAPTATMIPLASPTFPPTAVPTETPANEVVIDPDIKLTNTHQTEDGRLVVNYPDGWYSSGLRKPGETVNNAAISNNSSGFTGSPGQLLIQIFEPVYVMELFGIADTSVVTLEDIYTAIISGNEQGLLENGSEPKYLSLNRRELLRLDFMMPQFDTIMLSLRTTDGYIVQMNAVMSPGEINIFEDTVLAIASTLDYTAPDRDILEGSPASVVRDHFNFVQSGDLQGVLSLYCQQDLIFKEVLDFLVEDATDIEDIDEAFETIVEFDRALTRPDFSHLFYQTVLLEEGERATVRISGNVTITNSEGDRELVPYLDFTPVRTDGWRLIWENSQWRICLWS